MRRSILACGLLLALAGISSAAAAADGGGSDPQTTSTTTTTQAQTDQQSRADAQSIAYWDDKAQRAQSATARWLTVINGRPPRMASAKQSSSSPQAARDRARTWHQRALDTWRTAVHPPERRAWYCIHHYEGSWSDPDAPYWGGLQMDMNFQSAYAPWLLKHRGTADNWTPLEQIWTAVRAWHQRGFEPWGNSAHACGVY